MTQSAFDTMPAGPDARPFTDIRRLLRDLPPADTDAAQAVRARDANLVKPPGSLGRLEDLARWVAAWSGRAPPSVNRAIIAIFAADHGIAARGVSAYPQAVTRQVMETIAAGGAAVSTLARQAGAGLKVYDLAVGQPGPDIVTHDAMDERACVATMAFGMEALAEGPDLLVLGEVGIANTSVAAAVCLALYGGEAKDWVGPGTGVSGEALDAKAAAVQAVSDRLGPGPHDPLEVLARAGGREFAAIAGAILAARLQRVPVILDGYAVCAAAAVLHAVNPAALEHCLAGHVSAEPAHRALLARLGLSPLLDFDMRLGEGSGGALALQMVRTACAVHAGMATFAEAGVSGPA